MPNLTAALSSFIIVVTTNVSAWLIRLVGFDITVMGNNIELSNRILLVNLECTAIYLMILFSSFIAVYPTDWSKKTIGLAIGIPSIFVVNILRLLLTVYVSEYKPQYFDYFHDYMWQVAFIFVVVAFWIIWVEKVVGHER